MKGYINLIKHLKRLFLSTYIFVVSGFYIYLTASEFFIRHRGDGYYILSIIVITVLFLIVFFRRLLPVFIPSVQAHGVRNDYEFTLVLINVLYLLIGTAGISQFNLEPLLYLFVTFVLFFMPKNVGIFTIFIILLQETLTYLLSSQRSLTLYLGRIVFVVMFGLLYYLLSFLERIRNRMILKSQINREVHEYREKIKDYRLIQSQKADEIDRDTFLQATVLSIEDSFRLEFNIIKRLLRLHTIALFLFDETKNRLKLVYSISDSPDYMQSEKVERDAGLFAAILKSNEPIIVNADDRSIRGQVYYKKSQKIQSFIGVQVSERIKDLTLLRGVLVADRIEENFTEEHKKIFRMLSDFLGSYVQTQRLLHNISVEREQKSKFFEASRKFNDALTLEQVMDAALQASRVVSRSVSGIIITVSENGDYSHQRFAYASGESESLKKYLGKNIKDNSPVVKLVAEHRVKFPNRDFKGDLTTIYGDQFKIDGITEIKVFPLITRGEELIGTFAVYTTDGSTIGEEETYMLETISNILAISIENGIVVKKINDLATTDGLTGLFNHRVFQERLDDVIARANRSRAKFSLGLIDIDFFKKINDTYGHPVGDKVLKGLAGLLKRLARETDIVARYGGEEFAIIMEGTDENGALTFAERIRKEVEKLAFDAPEKTFNITISIGLATFFLDSDHKKELISCADKALYHSKENGRNQVWNYHLIKEKKS